MSSIEFPNEILPHLFKYLTRLEDRKSASLVNKLWREVYQCQKMREKERIRITRISQVIDLLKISNPKYQIYNLMFERMDLTKFYYSFWVRYGNDIHGLELINCNVLDFAVEKIIAHCPNLKNLAVVSCHSAFMSEQFMSDQVYQDLLVTNPELFECPNNYSVSEEFLPNQLPHLEYLNLASNPDLSDDTFIKMCRMSRKIKNLVLGEIPIKFEPDLAGKLYPIDDMTSLVTPSDSFLTFHFIYQYLCTADKITDLSFKGVKFDDVSLRLLCGIKTLKLNSIVLAGCDMITDKGVLALTQTQTTLTKLDLSCCSQVTDKSLKGFKNLKNLKVLSLEFCENITDEGLAELSCLALEWLNIAECTSITGKGLDLALCQPSKINMTQLKLRGLERVKDVEFIKVIKYLPNLTNLDLSLCMKGVTDDTIQSIIRSCHHMEVLIVSCAIITDWGVTGQLHRKLTDGSQTTEHTGVNLNTLSSMKCLVMPDCNNITDDIFKFSMEFEALVKLDLTSCLHITDVGVKYLTEKNPSLETLIVEDCNNISDLGVLYIMQNLKLLKMLIVGSVKITNTSLTYFEDYGKNLYHLDIEGCLNVDYDLAAKLEAKLNKLRRLFLPYNAKSDEFLTNANINYSLALDVLEIC